jgi:hypothetical protein
MMKLVWLFVLCVAFLLSRPSGLTGQLLTCNLPPLSSACETVLPLAQDSVQLSIQVNLPKPVPSPSASSLTITRTSGNTAEVTIAGTPVDTRRVTISSTHCCVTPQVATVDPNGYVNVTWRGTQRPKAPVDLTFAAAHGGTVQTGKVRITTQQAPPKPEPLAVSTTPYHQTAPRYVWIRGDHIPITIPVFIDSVGTTLAAGSGRLRRVAATRESCEKVNVVFTALQGGTASPDTVRALWYPRREGMAWHPTQGRCRAETRWRLADDAGEQRMDVVIGDDSVIARSRFIMTAFARQTPRLTGGYGYFGGLLQDREVTCAEIRTHARCTSRPDSDTVTIQVREGGGSAYFAVEFPIFKYRVSEGSVVGKYLAEHLRIVLGSTFERPSDNIFMGLTLMPLFSGASEAAPFQISAGVGSRGIRTWYVGMSLDATTIVAPVLGAIGIGN